MNPTTIETLMNRLLELEQRFESYCTLHEEELSEIKAALAQLNEDIFRLSQQEVDLNEGSSISERENSDEDTSFPTRLSI